MTMLVLLLTCGPLLAEEIYVRNQPYDGVAVGSGLQTEVLLDEIAKALELEAVKTDNGWTLDGKPLTVREAEGKTYVSLAELAKTGVRVQPSPQLGTIDIHQPLAEQKEPSKAAAANWGGPGPALIYFGADW